MHLHSADNTHLGKQSMQEFDDVPIMESKALNQSINPGDEFKFALILQHSKFNYHTITGNFETKIQWTQMYIEYVMQCNATYNMIG